MAPEVRLSRSDDKAVHIGVGGFHLGKGVGHRRHKRIKVVLPVRISGKDSTDNPVSELAHTLDITPNGARLGAIHRMLKNGDKLTLQYRQRRIQFRVVWVKPMAGTNEYQVGLEGISVNGDNWGLELPEIELVDEYQGTTSS
jgi:PilZ domain